MKLADVWRDERLVFGWPQSVPGFLVFVFIALLAFLAVTLQSPPETVPESAPTAEFSSARAMARLRVIARKPHPMGTAEHASVRRYLLDELAAAGLAAEVQETMVVDPAEGRAFGAATVRNVVARIKGFDNSRAVMLSGHYDSGPTSPGASDDGSAVAAMLETARALSASPYLKNDLILLFTDGEEFGLLGAKAFIREHPWARDVGLVLNFEARGNSGPSYMFETSPNNGWLIREFAQAVPYPQTSSLAYEIYRRLPNDTDMTIFKKAGMAGLNFAFIDGYVYYHSSIDDAQRIDERSLQHQGSYMLSLARHFGNLDLRHPKEGNAVYFSLLGGGLIHYPDFWIWPLTALVVLAFIIVLVKGLRGRTLTLTGLAAGLLVSLLTMIVAPAVVALTWWIIRRLHSSYAKLPLGDVYNSHVYMLSFVLLAVAVSSAIYILFRQKVRFHNLAAGAMIWGLLSLIIVARYMPGGSFLLTWPLLSGLIVLERAMAWKDLLPMTASRAVLLSLSAIPIVILFAPVVHQIFVALTISFSAPAIIVVAFVTGLLTTHLELISLRSKWALPILIASASAVLMVAGVLASSPSASRPVPDSILYVQDADRNTAIWASLDKAPDQWTSQFFSSGAERGTLTDYFPRSRIQFLKNPAPVAGLSAPDARLLGDSVSDGVRTLRLSVVSVRQAPSISICAESDGELMAASIDGKTISEKRTTRLIGAYLALPGEGVELILKAQPGHPVKLRLVDVSYELPTSAGISFKPRPDYLSPSLFFNGDSTYVSRSFTF